MPKSDIVFCFSDTGGGHRSATEAIEAAIEELLNQPGAFHDISVLADNVVEKTHPINRAFVDFYNFLLRHSQSSMKYYFWFIQFFKPNNSGPGYAISSKYLKELLVRNEPSVVVVVHPMIAYYLGRAIKELGILEKTKLITVITDPNAQLWRGWACPDSQLTIVPNQVTFDKLVEWGMDVGKLKIVGMPVHPEFCKPAQVEPHEFKLNLGLEPDRYTVCINAGWAGGGNMIAIYRALERIDRAIQVVFLCGHNQSLYQKATQEASKSRIPTAVLPFHDRLADLMAAMDLMITKAGGLTTYEAVARRLPLAFDMITPPMPQEAGTIDILVENRLASRIVRPKDILSIVQAAPEKRSNYLHGELPSAQSLDRVDAVYDIAKIILRNVDIELLLKPPIETRIN